MHAINDLWCQQLFEGMIEACILFEGFKESSQPNVEDLDKALAIHEEYCQVYNFQEITFEEFIEFGKSLRARQTLKTIQQDHDHE